jgi:hypothetical protein
MFDKIGQLQHPPFHPKWKEMAPRATVSGWTRFKAAQEWLDRNMPLPAGAAAASGAAPAAAFAAPAAALAPQEQRDPLYREFLEWRAGRAKAAPTGNRSGRYHGLTIDGPLRRAVVLLGCPGCSPCLECRTRFPATPKPLGSFGHLRKAGAERMASCR